MTKRIPMSQQILQMRTENPQMSAKEVADKLGVKLHYVHTTTHLARKKAGLKPKRKVGRPRKVRPVTVSVTDMTPRRNDAEEVRQIILKEYLTTIQNLKQEIEELTVIIAYLEHRCAKAERHGSSV